MALPGTDSFTGANGDALSSNWTIEGGSLLIHTNAVRCASGTFSIARWNADSFNAAQYAQIVVSAIGGSFVGPGTRLQSGANSGMGLYQRVTGSGTALGYTTAGSFTQLGSSGASRAVNDVTRLESNGNTHTPMSNGSTIDIGAQTNSTYTSGYAGVVGWLDDTTTRMDDWEGGNLGGGGGGGVFHLIGGLVGASPINTRLVLS